MATPLYDTPKLRPFIVTEASGQRSRENVVVTQTGTAIKSGAMLAKSGSKYIPYTDGATQNIAAILYEHLPAATGDAKAVAIVRDCEVNRFELSGLDTAGEADLLALGIVVRSKVVPSIKTPAL